MKQLRSGVICFVCAVILCGCASQNPQILIKTELGDIKAELYTKQAPITACNFLRYVKEKRFEGAVFYRVVTMDNQPNDKVKIQVVQGGLYDENHPNLLPPIAHETTAQTGIRHKNGTLSMARWGPCTATCEFSICVGAQPELDFAGKRNPDGQGFAAFGRVTSGMDVVRKIHRQPADGQNLNPQIKILDFVLLRE
jgi:peptidyl-prolyl cis-trans isomerase A (cyclophilin A)